MAETQTDAEAALERARIAYEAECARKTSTDAAERQEGVRRFREARAEYFRLLAERKAR